MPRPLAGPHGINRAEDLNILTKPIRPVYIAKYGKAYSTPATGRMEIWTNLTAEDINRRDKSFGTVYFRTVERVQGWSVNLVTKQRLGVANA